ncbi:MAG: immunoglobulin domain-containing protein [Verrucomicrobia bacterium]|nr:immunoglobulin domain-containing protein [Verrucomicrobiota bacterium]
MKIPSFTVLASMFALTASLASAQNYSVSTLAGQAGAAGSADGSGPAARFNVPAAIAVDSTGNIFVGETNSAKVRKITPAGVVSTHATLANGTAALVVDAAGHVYVADAAGHVIRRIASDGTISVFAGMAGAPGNTDGTGGAARFNSPQGLARDGAGNLFVADTANHTIRRITPAGVVTTLAGLAGVSGNTDGPGPLARFSQPGGVAVDAAGIVYVADTANRTLRKIDAAGAVTTLAGSPGSSGSVDGTGTAARFGAVRGLAVDATGVLFASDSTYHLVRKITPTGVVTTIAGAASASGGTDGAGGAARFSVPLGIALDAAGNFYVADSGNHTVRQGTFLPLPVIGTPPVDATVAAGQTATFTVAATGPGALTYQWERRVAGTGGFVALAAGGAYAGVTTATLTVSAASVTMHGDQFRCVIGSGGGPATSAAATLTVTAPPVFTSAAGATFYTGQAGTFTFVVTGSPAPTFAVTAGALPAWATLGATTGVLSGTPPGTSGSPFSFTVTATNGSGTASQTFTLTIAPAPVVPAITTSSAARQLVASGGSLLLSVSVSGTTPITFQWKRNGRPIAGATDAGLAITGASARDVGYYQVVVSNAAGSTVAPAIFVNVAYPVSQVVAWGSNNGGEMDVPAGLTSAMAIAAGNSHALALRTDGTVITWGSGTGASVPAGLNNVVAVAAAHYFALALKSDGTVVTWGSGAPTPPAGLAGVVAIAGGGGHGLALKADGTVVAWGNNSYGQAAVPAGLSGVVEIAAGSSHSVAVKADGSVVTWGDQTSVPASVANITAVAAQQSTTIAAKGDGTVVVWGNASFGLGSVPAGLSGVVDVALGYYQSVALKSDGSIVVWGDNYNVSVPLPPAVGGVVAVAAGPGVKLGLRDASNDLAPSVLTSPASVAANLGQGVTFSVGATAGTAGLNYQWSKDGALITGATSASYTINGVAATHAGSYSVAVSNTLGSVTSAAATLSLNASPVVSAAHNGRYPLTVGQNLTLTLAPSVGASATVQWRRNGLALAGATARSVTITGATLADGGWYQAVYNEGAGAVISGAIFVPVVSAATQIVAWGDSSYYSTINVPAGLTNVVSLAARGNSAVAVRADGTVVRWGYYSSTVPAGLANVVAAALGGSSSYSNFYLALRADGTVATWGDSSSTAPAVPTGLANVVAVAAGSAHALALKGDGTVVAWGAADYGATAVPAGLANVVAIAANGYFNLALRADGTVVGWGRNQYGESVVPAGLSGVVAIAAGGNFSVALKGDGTVVAWGYNGSGQTTVPAGLAGVTAVAAGDGHTLARKSDGTVVAWGTTSYAVTVVPAALRRVVDVVASSYNSFALRDASGDTAPVVTTQPVSMTAFASQNVTLRVAASAGTNSVAYQWRKAGVPIAGATDATLTLPAVTAAQADIYDVMVSNYLGATLSQPATLAVSATPGATTDLTGRRVLAAGASLTLTGATPLVGPVTYQWRRNGQPIAGATSVSYTITSATWSSGGAYQFVATNSVGPAASASVYVVVSAGAQVRAWGSNSYGETAVPALPADVMAVAAGYYHSLALKGDGTVAAWGRNDTSQCNVPSGLSNVVAIAAGSGFSLALSGDGAVTTWGSINFTPAAAAGAIAIAASSTSGTAMALRADGTVVAWTYSGVSTTVPSGLRDVVGIATGGLGQLAVKADGTVVQWGDYYANQYPVPAGLANVVAVSSGSYYALALKADGTVAAWGSSSSATAVPAGLTGVVAICAGYDVSFALKADGTVVAWGGGSSSSVVTGAVALSPAFAISAGYTHAVGLRDSSRDAAPVIASVSPAQTFVSGQSVTLSVTASGTPTPTYQWYRNGIALSGSTAATLAVSQTGTYSVTVSNALGAVTSADIVVTSTPSLTQRGLLTSTARADAGVALTGTFTVEGATAKTMLVRAIGPALTAFGVTGVLTDPRLAIISASGVEVVANDDWGTNTNAATIASTSATVGAYALASNAKDAAILRSFAPGTYQVRVSGGGTATGVAMLEIYDADSTPRTVYVATHAFAGAGSQVFVQGFVVAGAPAGRSYLVRALGPSLGSPGALADPQLKIFDAAGVQVAANDNWGGDSALATLAASVGAMPLAAGSADAAVNFTPPAAGAYTVQVGGAAGTTGGVLVEIFEADVQRASTLAPAIVAAPQGASVVPGSSVTFGVATIGLPEPTLQWRRNGAAIAGATAAQLTLANVQTADAGDYTVVATNSVGSATSSAATLNVVTMVARHGIVGNGYVAGSTVTISNTFTFSGTPASLGWQVVVPAGWSYASGGGAEGDVKPAAGSTGTIAWAWTTSPASPLTFTYTLNVPAGETAERTLSAVTLAQVNGSTQSVAATPASLAIGPAPTVHSADFDRDGKLNLAELLRVIELYNYRAGTVRTGQYTLATGTATDDGFTPGPNGAALNRFHSADTMGASVGTPPDGKLNLAELLRVIELYNYRAGTVRTGQYRVLAGTDDGFAPGP